MMLGSGNVGLIVSYQLLQAGADVVGVVDIADHVGGYEVHYDRVSREGVPIYLNHRLLAAEGESGVEAVLVEDMQEGRLKRFSVDSVCMALGLTPLAELAAMRGCRTVYCDELGGFLPWHDREMRTDRPGVYVAGDTAGVEEAAVAMEEGRMAGLSAAEDLGSLSRRQAAAGKKAVRVRLDGLRVGPYGSARHAAKERIYCV
jgi:thioredoxin reductase